MVGFGQLFMPTAAVFRIELVLSGVYLYKPLLLCAVYSTTTNKMEVKLAKVEEEEHLLQAMRRANCCTRLWMQWRHRTAFMATPLQMWLFLVVLGLFTSFGM